jgi:predicted amidohydrolase YtcJ
MANPDPHSATLLLHNARVYTGDHALPWAEAVAIKGDRIAWVGSEAGAALWRGPRTEVVNAGGRLLLPGLTDSHIHLLWGARALGDLALDDAATLPECLQRLRAYADANPDLPWIKGRGWRYSLFARGEAIHRALLDAAVPDRPVYLTAFDGHTAWANTRALELAGILGGAEAGPNSLVVLGDDGAATGELRESGAMAYVRSLLPAPTPADDERLLGRALRELAALGVTGAHNMDGDAAQIALYQRLAERGELTLRVRCPMSFSPDTPLERLDEFARIGAAYVGPWVRGGCVKLFADGVVESKTALLLAPYADGSDDLGAANYEEDHVRRVVARADALGQQVIVHAIGDGAVRMALDAFEHARVQNGIRDSRHRVEHVELLDPADLRRFRALGVVASMQPVHANFGFDEQNPWRRLAGPERWAWGFPWRALLDAGAPLAFGSDWPVASCDPLLGMQVAQTRIKLDFSAANSPFPDQRPRLEQTVAAYTAGAAHAGFAERELGRIASGFLADMVLLSENIFELPPDRIASARSALTIVGGRIVGS